jgi:V8-like Glu-specific endopeptidase
VSRVGLDFALFSINKPIATRAFIEVPSDVHVRRGDDVFLIGHPGGGPKEVAFAQNEVTYIRKHLIRYSVDTMVGSSGAPVFDWRFSLIAMHHRGDEEQTYNEGILISHIKPAIDHLLPIPT